jgi:hypothetical protein
LYLPLTGSAQLTKRYPQHYFRWPLDLKPEIVANMGELRTNHWHMGLDIRTAQKVNQRVYAAADGYISSISVRPLGYGRSIMIVHPNGFTTLYAHLNDFAPEIEKYVTEQQYRQESWAIELTIPPGKFPVKKGDFISYSGTTGGSQGPHLHFEIRDTKTGKCLNPLLFGMPLTDNVKPTFTKLALYDRGLSVYDQSPQLISVKNVNGSYSLTPSSNLKTGSTKISFGISAFDRISGSANQDGIFSAKLFFDGRLYSAFEIDSIDYDATRYMNAQIDYSHKARGGVYIQHLSVMPGDRSSVYDKRAGNGVIELKDTDIHKVRIEISDAYGNKSELNFSVQYDPSLKKNRPVNSTKESFLPGYVNVLEKPGFEAYLPDDCLYDTVTPVYLQSNSTAANAISTLHQLNDETIPLHTNMRIRIKPDKPVPASLTNKVYIQRTYRSNNDVSIAQWENGWVSATFNKLGSFQAFVDTEPPFINGLGKGDTVDLSASSRIIFTPTDNSAIKSFRATLNGKWLRFTNDKGRSWIYIFDERCPYGVHELKVRVEDIAGNVTTKTFWFKKFPYTPPVKKTVPAKKTTSAKKKK